jgi:hypothetical protein
MKTDRRGNGVLSKTPPPLQMALKDLPRAPAVYRETVPLPVRDLSQQTAELGAGSCCRSFLE